MSAPPTNEGRTFPPEPLTPDEFRRLLKNISSRSTSGIRLRAIAAVMYGAGTRLNETLMTEPRDIDFEAGSIRIRYGKRKAAKPGQPSNPPKVRVVGIDQDALAHLQRWTDIRPRLGLTGRHPVFATYSAGNVGKHLDPRYVRAALSRARERAGITKRVHPHGLRHSAAFRLAMNRVPIIVIKEQLGHESLDVTHRYVRHLAPAQLIEIMQQQRWETP